MTKPILAILLATLLTASSHAAVWQYSVDIDATGSRADLYVPPSCQRVRGVIIALDNLEERPILEDATVRDAAADAGLAEIWIAGGAKGRPFNAGFDPKKGDDALLDKILAGLAGESGYSEIASAPLLPIGHSAGVPFAWGLAEAHPDRIIGAIPFKSWLPGMPGHAPRVESVPVLIVKAQFEEWAQPGGPTDREASWSSLRKNALGLRAHSDRNAVGFILDAGAGHFECEAPLMRILAMFIRKSAAARIPADATGDGAVKLRDIAPESGWLTDSAVAVEDAPPQVAAWKDFAGDRSRAFWYFDRELAEAVRHYGAEQKGKLDQMVTFSRKGEPWPLSPRGIVELTFDPIDDGRTFKLSGGFFAKVPDNVLHQGETLGHAEGPVGVGLVKGPADQIGVDTFRFRPDVTVWPSRNSDLWFIAEHPGDARYRHAVQAGHIALPGSLARGTPQTITFPEIPDPPVGTREIALSAKAASGLPVGYYIRCGPAEIVGEKRDRLRFTPLPTRSRSPVPVTVVATQWGRTIDPLYQSAEPVSRTFKVAKAEK